MPWPAWWMEVSDFDVLEEELLGDLLSDYVYGRLYMCFC